ncbi:MAG: hypothetical protein WC656_01450 [Sulfurimonas sp.]|jgi:hypothetical protein
MTTKKYNKEVRTVKQKLDACYTAIRWLMTVITFVGSGFTATVIYNIFIKQLLGEIVLQGIVMIELISIFFFMALIIQKFVIIEKLNFEEISK